MASCANLDIYQGDDFAQGVEVFGEDDTAVDLTGYTALAQIRTDVADSASVTAELTVVIQLPNTIMLSLSHEVTKDLTEDYIWDLELTDPLGTVTTLMTGDVRVTLEVSRVA